MPKCCCCCCPPAISALFCLWFRNGCSKASVAGALTFFPPQPSLYQFERLGKDGEKLPSPGVNNEGEDDDQVAANSEVQKQSSSSRSGRGNSNSESSSSKPENPMADLSQRQKELQKSARKKFLLDQEDAKNGVSYKYSVSTEICPSRFTPYVEQMQALKIYNAKAKSYIATVIYRYKIPATTDQPVTTAANLPNDSTPAAHASSSTPPTTAIENNNSSKAPMTLIYSHGNATDVGGMSFLHCYLARALQLNVVMYDYSGYGESGYA